MTYYITPLALFVIGIIVLLIYINKENKLNTNHQYETLYEDEEIIESDYEHAKIKKYVDTKTQKCVKCGKTRKLYKKECVIVGEIMELYRPKNGNGDFVINRKEIEWKDI